MPVSKTDLNLWSAFIGEAKANRLYVAYAMKAMEEGLPEVAQIFMEVSGAETIHAVSHLRAAGEVRSTVENLVAVIRDEAMETDTMYPRMAQEADAEGRPEAAASFRLAGEREGHHLEAFQQALQGLLERRPDLRPLAARAALPPTAMPPAERGAPVAAPELGERAVQEVLGEKQRISTLQRLREVMFGAQDGLVSTVAVVSSVALATGDNGVVFIAGATSGLAGMVSMAAGSYLGSRAEQEVQLSELEIEAREIAEHPAEELAELVEIYQREGMGRDEAIGLAERVASDRQLMLKTMAEKELGVTPEPLLSPWKDSLTMGLSFISGAVFPMLPYGFLPARAAVVPAIVLTLFVLFLVGVGKGMVLHRPSLRSGLEVVAVGTASAALGYVIGSMLPSLLGIGGLAP
ncbi:MAG: VIT1/CCC1 transporter family protein [Chloroflexi bacterium]|nr:VIT1/CCC1 transporter family protein [Chloroflexota bacterium]